ncbi:MAG: hypothetical protein K2Y05_10150 [Hyphomicrobiaceae bacterium]|nr:hypothetical protein [Hyphomicrobiaceae bacterium]
MSRAFGPTPVAWIALITVAIAVPAGAAETFTFDDQGPETPPAGFTEAVTGDGGPAIWRIRKAPGEQRGNVLVQTSAEPIDARFPLLINDTLTTADVDLAVRFQVLSGAIDQAAGLVWRYRDPANYYLVRATALEDNVVLYKVENGRRSVVPRLGQGSPSGHKAAVIKGAWNILTVKVRGTRFSVGLNGKALYEVEDATFVTPGKVGLWTKSDSVTMFDDFYVGATTEAGATAGASPPRP